MKTMRSKRKEKEPEQPHSSRFLSRKHEKHFKVVQDRRLLMERKVGMIPNFVPQFGEQLLGNDWGKLATYPTPANIAVVKEFYTNARKIGGYPAENYLGYVRGHAIRYDSDSINNFLDTYWMAFSHANIQPCSHVSDITLSRALLLYCAIRNLNVNIGQVIADEIRVCANTTNSKAPLGHPSLITHLCKIAGVDTSAPPLKGQGKQLTRPIIDNTVEVRKQLSQFHHAVLAEKEGKHKLQAIHRGQVATTEMIVGMYDTPPAHRWTMEEFHNVVAWPEEFQLWRWMKMMLMMMRMMHLRMRKMREKRRYR
ncbi:hypothetical protein LR48_Vigan04g093700 [Vigna angularis]|uniref:Putative plant transposon protein domain-containing protein n=1 Tax=Phaseolus angularis TaxID=3914 RepID=A0A0L9UDX8_PHAAN|nr:hypothetical protein LR48_Vigan04g093700 [Vigna angularis]